MVRAYSPAERTPIWGGTTEDWSHENWGVAHDWAYALALGGDPCGPVPPRAMLSPETIEKLVEPARLQVLRGGLRLARLLDETLG